MTAGIPGTGIGGLFYLLLVILMPLREMSRALHERGDLRSWRPIGAKVMLACGIFAALWLEAWVLFDVLGLRSSYASYAGASAGEAARAASVATLASLGLVLFVLRILRLLVRRPLAGRRASQCAASARHSMACPLHTRNVTAA